MFIQLPGAKNVMSHAFRSGLHWPTTTPIEAKKKTSMRIFVDTQRCLKPFDIAGGLC